MKRLYNGQEAFEADITIFTESEGGRKSLAHNGIRWDFILSEDIKQFELHRIHPDFVDESGDSLDKGIFLEGKLHAFMYILSDTKLSIYKQKISVGTEFFCIEGSKKVAHGIVTKITGLNDLSER